MLVTNYSDRPHRYQEPGAGGGLFRWLPGQVLEVPDAVGLLMRRVHPDKFAVPNPPTDYVTEDLQSGDYVTETPRPRSRARRGGGNT